MLTNLLLFFIIIILIKIANDLVDLYNLILRIKKSEVETDSVLTTDED